MRRYVIRRLLAGIVLLFALTLATFLIFKASPLDPACFVVPCGQGVTTTDAQMKAARHKLGADRPIYVQYAKFIWRLVRTQSFGTSYSGEAIGSSIRTALPETAFIVTGGMAVLLLLAIPLGVVSALHANTRIDRAVLFVSIFGIALHPFVVGFLLRRVFAHWLGIAPTEGYCPLHGGTRIQAHYLFKVGESYPVCHGGVGEWAGHLALPWLTFALFFLPLYMRIIRTRVLETLHDPHIATARAKGASEARVLQRHVLRIALLPVIPMVAMDIGGALMAAIYIEISFNFSGLGELVLGLLESDVPAFDLPLIASVFLVVGTIMIVLSLIADLVQFALDPRTRAAISSV
jgi:peptide/nickel transport system permease protein